VARAYLSKPVKLDELTTIVEQAVRLGKMARVKREAIELLGDHTKELGDRASLEVTFERALDRLHMVYQPIVHCTERRVVAHEALLRSNEPTLPHPKAILDAAQRLGKLDELGRAVRRHVAATVSGSTIPQVFVNLHPCDMLDDDLYSPQAPLSLIAKRVVLEITERASLDTVNDVPSRVASLRRLGFRIAIDDMGAGYAGLTSIAQLEPEVMKIDMALVRGLDASITKQKVVDAMVSLCAEMSVLVIAEGIETPRERDTLLRLHCDVMQGYLFAKPGIPFPDPDF
jgi:EAL domain-containing protein (putative c-di-GMP-specific phosphodiesterase class I)